MVLRTLLPGGPGRHSVGPALPGRKRGPEPRLRVTAPVDAAIGGAPSLQGPVPSAEPGREAEVREGTWTHTPRVHFWPSVPTQPFERKGIS